MVCPCRHTCWLLAAVALVPSAAHRCAAQSGEVLLSYSRDQPTLDAGLDAPMAAEPINPLRAAGGGPEATYANAAPTNPPPAASSSRTTLSETDPPVVALDLTDPPATSLPRPAPIGEASYASHVIDLAATPAAATVETDAPSEMRRLAPPSDETSKTSVSLEGDASARTKLPFSFPAGQSLTTVAMGLATVIALFLVCAWLFRRAGPARPGVLPSEAFSLLGVAPLAGRNVAHLIRLGNKLVLLAVGAEGVQTLAEVTDPAEVDRLAGLCAAGSLYGPTAEFQQVLAQLAKEPARGFLGRESR